MVRGGPSRLTRTELSYPFCGTIFVFRAKLPNVERPYRCVGYPVVPAVYVLVLAAVAINTLVTQRVEAAVGVGFILLGGVIYAAFLRRPA